MTRPVPCFDRLRRSTIHTPPVPAAKDLLHRRRPKEGTEHQSPIPSKRLSHASPQLLGMTYPRNDSQARIASAPRIPQPHSGHTNTASASSSGHSGYKQFGQGTPSIVPSKVLFICHTLSPYQFIYKLMAYNITANQPSIASPLNHPGRFHKLSESAKTTKKKTKGPFTSNNNAWNRSRRTCHAGFPRISGLIGLLIDSLIPNKSTQAHHRPHDNPDPQAH